MLKGVVLRRLRDNVSRRILPPMPPVEMTRMECAGFCRVCACAFPSEISILKDTREEKDIVNIEYSSYLNN